MRCNGSRCLWYSAPYLDDRLPRLGVHRGSLEDPHPGPGLWKPLPKWLYKWGVILSTYISLGWDPPSKSILDVFFGWYTVDGSESGNHQGWWLSHFFIGWDNHPTGGWPWISEPSTVFCCKFLWKDTPEVSYPYLLGVAKIRQKTWRDYTNSQHQLASQLLFWSFSFPPWWAKHLTVTSLKLTNIAPEILGLEDEFLFGKASLQVRTVSCRGVSNRILSCFAVCWAVWGYFGGQLNVWSCQHFFLGRVCNFFWTPQIV